MLSWIIFATVAWSMLNNENNKKWEHSRDVVLWKRDKTDMTDFEFFLFLSPGEDTPTHSTKAADCEDPKTMWRFYHRAKESGSTVCKTYARINAAQRAGTT